MKRSIAIWPRLNGEVKLVAHSSTSESVWRNGGHWGNSVAALQADDEHDTRLLGALLTHFPAHFGATTTMINPTLVTLRVRPWHLPSMLIDLCQIFRADEVNHVTLFSRHPKVV